MLDFSKRHNLCPRGKVTGLVEEFENHKGVTPLVWMFPKLSTKLTEDPGGQTLEKNPHVPGPS